MAALFRRRQSPRAPEAPAQGQDRTRRRTIRQSRLPVRTLLIAGGLLTGLTLLLLRAGPQQPAARQKPRKGSWCSSPLRPSPRGCP
jgi:hypothetical protein